MTLVRAGVGTADLNAAYIMALGAVGIATGGGL